MRIGLVIFPFVPSHGSILQTFAIYTKLKDMGHSVTIINRRRPPIGLSTVILRAISNLKSKLKGTYHGPVLYRGYTPKAIMKKLMPFINSYFGKDIITVYSSKETRKLVESQSFDAFIVGSDQVWRPKYVPDIYHYYLDFLSADSEVKKIAFCPSFGTDDWEYSLEQTEKCKELLSRFSAVAVRENGGVVLCRNYLNKEVTHLLDPTILFPASKYSDVFLKRQKKNNNLSSQFGLASVYYLDTNLEKTAIVNKVCERLYLKSVYVNNHIQDTSARLRDRIAPSLFTWIAGFYDAAFVVTDSFHATMFALYYNKPFIAVINEQRGAARFRSIMEELGLQDRLVSSPDAIFDSLLTASIDWDRINSYLAEQRNRSVTFLYDSLKA